MHAPSTMFLSEVHTRRAIFGRLQQSPCTALSLAALVNVDLRLIEAVLDRLVEEGRVVRDGVLYQFPLLAA